MIAVHPAGVVIVPVVGITNATTATIQSSVVSPAGRAGVQDVSDAVDSRTVPAVNVTSPGPLPVAADLTSRRRLIPVS
jgi:hypothetical protein